MKMIELILGGLAEGHDDPGNYSIEQSASKQEQQEKCQYFFVDCIHLPYWGKMLSFGQYFMTIG
jgi:hypothetical protein